MARIAGVDLPREKKVLFALPYIYGIGPSNAKKILAETGVSPDARVRDLRDAEVAMCSGVNRLHFSSSVDAANCASSSARASVTIVDLKVSSELPEASDCHRMPRNRSRTLSNSRCPS